MTKRLIANKDSRTISAADKASIVRLVNAEKTDRQTALELGIHHKTVAAYRRKAGLGPNGMARRFLKRIGQDHAQCSRCEEIKPLVDWPQSHDQTGSRYLLSYCRDCRRRQTTLAQNRTVKVNLRTRWSRLRARSKKIGALFLISFEQFWSQWKKQNGKCFYTDAVLSLDYGNGITASACSVDKIVPESGYVDGNVVFASHRINSIKRDITIEEMRAWMPDWHARVVSMWRARGIPCAQVAEGDF